MIVYDTDLHLRELKCKIFEDKIILPNNRAIYFPIGDFLAGDLLMAVYDPVRMTLAPLTRKKLYAVPAARRGAVLEKIADQTAIYRNLIDQLKECKSGTEIINILSEVQQKLTVSRHSQVFQVNLTRGTDDPITRNVKIGHNWIPAFVDTGATVCLADPRLGLTGERNDIIYIQGIDSKIFPIPATTTKFSIQCETDAKRSVIENVRIGIMPLRDKIGHDFLLSRGSFRTVTDAERRYK
jgi:hypothetical protein